ncbi:MAG: large subunit ribosomal protein L25 [Parcubacteria group bacterium Gr01-1014_17]|nr:MAG: large subunit ribosomal protein L25 [Parcubacteria group bacterium Gr01-1014_17]
MISLAYEKRDTKAKPAAVRRAGKIPAVFYGKKRASTSIEIVAKAFEKAFAKAGENEVVTLQGSDGDVPALVHDVARHPVSGNVLHVDFYAFEAGQKLAVKVPIEFVGVAPAVKEKGGVLVKVLRELHIEAEPAKLPHIISIDVAPLVDFDSQILAKQIRLPDGVSLLEKPEEVVASVYEPKEEKVEVAPAPDLSQIEVVKKGKEPKEVEVAEAVTDEKSKVGGVEKKLEKKEGKKEEKKK